MNLRLGFIKVLLVVLTCACTKVYYSSWDGSSYEPSIHKFKVDSLYFNLYGNKGVDTRIKYKTADKWIVDSIVYYNISLEQDYKTMPIIPVFFRIKYQKKAAPFNYQISIHNNKIYRKLDSIKYIIYDSLKTYSIEGNNLYNLDISLIHKTGYIKSPFLIKDAKLDTSAYIYSDLIIYYVDKNDSIKADSLQSIKLKFHNGDHLSNDLNL